LTEALGYPEVAAPEPGTPLTVADLVRRAAVPAGAVPPNASGLQ
jgi:hypothetical protein